MGLCILLLAPDPTERSVYLVTDSVVGVPFHDVLMIAGGGGGEVRRLYYAPEIQSYLHLLPGPVRGSGERHKAFA